MGLFGDDKKLMEKLAEIDVLKHQQADLRNELKDLSMRFGPIDADKIEIHKAIKVLDNDLADSEEEMKESLRKFDDRLSKLERTVDDVRLFGKLALENREEINTILNILKKIAEPDFREVAIAHDAEIDRFRKIESEIDELKENEILVERRR